MTAAVTVVLMIIGLLNFIHVVHNEDDLKIKTNAGVRMWVSKENFLPIGVLCISAAGIMAGAALARYDKKYALLSLQLTGVAGQAIAGALSQWGLTPLISNFFECIFTFSVYCGNVVFTKDGEEDKHILATVNCSSI